MPVGSPGMEHGDHREAYKVMTFGPGGQRVYASYAASGGTHAHSVFSRRSHRAKSRFPSVVHALTPSRLRPQVQVYPERLSRLTKGSTRTANSAAFHFAFHIS